MKQHERDEELANTSTQSIPSKEPSRRPSRASAKVTHSLRQEGPVASTTALILSMQL